MSFPNPTSTIEKSFYYNCAMQFNDHMWNERNGFWKNFFDGCIFQADYLIAKNACEHYDIRSNLLLSLAVWSVYQPSYFLYHKYFITTRHYFMWKSWLTNLILIMCYVYFLDYLDFFHVLKKSIKKINFYNVLAENFKKNIVVPVEYYSDLDHWSFRFPYRVKFNCNAFNFNIPEYKDIMPNLYSVYYATTAQVVNLSSIAVDNAYQTLPVKAQNFVQTVGQETTFLARLVQHNVRSFYSKPFRLYIHKSLKLLKNSIYLIDTFLRRYGKFGGYYGAVSSFFLWSYKSIYQAGYAINKIFLSNESDWDKFQDMAIKSLEWTRDSLIDNTPILNVAFSVLEGKELMNEYENWLKSTEDFARQAMVFTYAMATARPYLYALLYNRAELDYEIEKYEKEKERRAKLGLWGKFYQTIKDLGNTLWEIATFANDRELDPYVYLYDKKYYINPNNLTELDKFLNENMLEFIEFYYENNNVKSKFAQLYYNKTLSVPANSSLK